MMKHAYYEGDMRVESATCGEKVRGLAPEWAEKARKELNETPQIVEDSLAAFRARLEDETELNANNTDEFLLRFLRAKKFNVSKAFTMLQHYYQMKANCPELFCVSQPSKKRHVLEMQCQTLLSNKADNGSTIYIFRIGNCDVNKVTVEDVFCTNVMALESAVREPQTQVAGITGILDMSGFGLHRHSKFISPYYAKLTVDVVQDTFPLRFKAFHVINQPFYFDTVFSIIKPFLREKIRKRIHLHGNNLKSLHNHISKDILPLEYGGTEPFDNSSWQKVLVDLEDEFVEMEKYGYKFPQSQETR